MSEVRDQFADRQRAMIAAIEAEARESAPWTGVAAIDAAVLSAMAEVPREAFISPDLWESAYFNAPLPIGCGQTISQPFIVALMTHLLRPHSDDVVLEIGTGSGYQAAVLSRLVRTVYSMEVIDDLASEAAQLLTSLGYDNVVVRCGDGTTGWAEHAPFNSVIVTAAVPSIPQALTEQLAVGGRLVAPVGEPGWSQELVVAEKKASGEVRQRNAGSVAFVPITHGRKSSRN